MGVRINSSVSAAKASAQRAASTKDGQPAAGTDTDFSEVLAKAQPKKEAEAAAPSDKPAPAAAKVAGKKPAKSKERDERADESQSGTPTDSATKHTKVSGDEDDAAPAADSDDDTTPVAAADDGDKSDRDKSADGVTATTNGLPPAVQTDPAQVAAQAAASAPQTPTPTLSPVPEQKSQRGAAVTKAANATPAENLVAMAKGTPASAKDRKAADGPGEDDVEGVTPTGTPEEAKIAVHPANQGQGDQAQADGEQDGTEVHAQAKPGASQVATAANPVAQFNELFQSAVDQISGDGAEKSTDKAVSPTDAALTAVAGNAPAPKAAEAKAAQPPAPPVPPDVRFAEDNHPKVVTAVKSQLLPGGGSIQLRLDPPDLGPLRLEVRMEDGLMSASFVTASDQATSLLTHTLGQLKHALEGAGINVDKLQVRQGSAEQFADGSDQRQQQGAAGDQSSARQEQQRREMLNRMWRKVAGGDPLDLVA